MHCDAVKRGRCIGVAVCWIFCLHDGHDRDNDTIIVPLSVRASRRILVRLHICSQEPFFLLVEVWAKFWWHQYWFISI